MTQKRNYTNVFISVLALFLLASFFGCAESRVDDELIIPTKILRIKNDFILNTGFYNNSEVFVYGIFDSEITESDTIIVPVDNETGDEFISQYTLNSISGLPYRFSLKAFVDSETVLLRGISKIGSEVVALYDTKLKKISWISPEDTSYKFLGWSRDRHSILVEYVPNIGGIEIAAEILNETGVKDEGFILEIFYLENKFKTLYVFDRKNISDSKCRSSTYASISSDGLELVLSGAYVQGECAVRLILNPYDLSSQRILDVDTNYFGTAYWLNDDSSFLMTCDASRVCLYSADGTKRKVFKYKKDNYFLDDYNPKSGFLLLREGISGKTESDFLIVSKLQ